MPFLWRWYRVQLYWKDAKEAGSGNCPETDQYAWWRLFEFPSSDQERVADKLPRKVYHCGYGQDRKCAGRKREFPDAEISENLSYSQLLEKFMGKIIKFFSIPLKNPNSLNFIKRRFLNPYFNNEIIEENYIDFFNSEKSIKRIDNSIMFKKIKWKMMKPFL